MMNPQKIKALFANVVAPGAGHFVLKKWLRGSLFLLAAIAVVIWLFWAFATDIIGNYSRVADGGDIKFDAMDLVRPFIAIFVLWVYTYLDLLFFCKTGTAENSEAEK